MDDLWNWVRNDWNGLRSGDGDAGVSGFGLRLLPGQWGQLLDPVNRVIGDPFENISQIGEGFDVMPFACPNQRINNRRTPTAPITADE